MTEVRERAAPTLAALMVSIISGGPGGLCKHIIVSLIALDAPLAAALQAHYQQLQPSAVGAPSPAAAKGANANQPAKTPRAKRDYVPRYRSGAYAIMVCLYAANSLRISWRLFSLSFLVAPTKMCTLKA